MTDAQILEFEAARKRYEEHTDKLWGLAYGLPELEDQLVEAKSLLAFEDAEIRLHDTVMAGKNEKERDALFTSIASGGAEHHAAAMAVRKLTVEIAQRRADIEREEYIIREWRLALTFLANPRELP